MRTLLVCGGRDYTDRDFVFQELDNLRADWCFDTLIHGDARGADRLAGEWARSRRISERSYPADWSRHGTAAGAIRNLTMLKVGKPDRVLAFPGGSGTAHMVRAARKAGVPVRVYE